MSSSTFFSKMSAIFFVLALSTQSILAASISSNPMNLKKDHGAFCDVCLELVKGGEQIGETSIDVYLDASIGTLCYTMLFPIHKECVEELDSLKSQLKQDIENKEAPKKACRELELC